MKNVGVVVVQSMMKINCPAIIVHPVTGKCVNNATWELDVNAYVVKTTNQRKKIK